MSSAYNSGHKFAIIALTHVVFISTFTVDLYTIASANQTIQFTDDNFFLNIHSIPIYRFPY